MPDLNIAGAIEYNIDKSGRLWNQKDLPWPLSLQDLHIFVIGIDTVAFVATVAMFQHTHGLFMDGKLGPATYALMRSIPEIIDAHEQPRTLDGAGDVNGARGSTDQASSHRPARDEVSNCLIIDGQSVHLPDSMLNLGITASNYIDDDEDQFDQYRLRKKVTNFVIHESVTMSAAQTNRILTAKRKKSAKAGKVGGKGWDYGIHLNLAPDGHISCHADLVRHRLVHANQLNDSSFGMEVVNPYNPKFGRGPFTETIPAPWWCWVPKDAKRLYCLPTPAQMRALLPFCRFLAENIPDLPFEFPTANLNSKKRRIDGWNKRKRPGPGIVAHRDFASHADGRYLLEHVIELSKKPLRKRA